MRHLWINPGAGVAGDMLLAALVDLGADADFVRGQLEHLGLDGWSLGFEAVRRRELTATLATVTHAEGHHHRSWSSIDALLAGAGLAPRVEQGARRTFGELGQAEARAHGIAVDDVHFHEVGALDAIVDIVGVWAALDSLDVDHVTCAAVGLGSGVASMAHGQVQVPAPAVLDLLTGLPVRPVDIDGETATPTGVALLRTLVDDWGVPPAGTVVADGRGAGAMDPPGHANVVVVALLETADATEAAGHTAAEHTIVECNLDDVTPEVVGHAIERALALGASDAWATSITMKKSRPGHLLSVLCAPEVLDEVAASIVAETGTLGYRLRRVDKVELPRSTSSVELDGHMIRIKVGPHGVKPEHDDVASVAVATGRTHREVSAAALRAWSCRD